MEAALEADRQKYMHDRNSIVWSSDQDIRYRMTLLNEKLDAEVAQNHLFRKQEIEVNNYISLTVIHGLVEFIRHKQFFKIKYSLCTQRTRNLFLRKMADITDLEMSIMASRSDISSSGLDDGNESHLIVSQERKTVLELFASALPDMCNGCYINFDNFAIVMRGSLENGLPRFSNAVELAQNQYLEKKINSLAREKNDNEWYILAYKEKQTGAKFSKHDQARFDRLGLYRNRRWVRAALAREEEPATDVLTASFF